MLAWKIRGPVYTNIMVPSQLGTLHSEDLSKKILVESDSDGLSNLIRTLVNLFFVEISRFEHSNQRFLVEIRVESIRDFFWIFTLGRGPTVVGTEQNFENIFIRQERIYISVSSCFSISSWISQYIQRQQVVSLSKWQPQHRRKDSSNKKLASTRNEIKLSKKLSTHTLVLRLLFQRRSRNGLVNCCSPA